MLVAVLSDIHGNMEALNAVWQDMAPFSVDRIACLGDMIGYGPNPDEVLCSVRERNALCCLGNHELGIAFARERRWFNPTARKGLALTASLLSQDSLTFIATLPRSFVYADARFVHGFPPDSPTTYLFEVLDERIRDWCLSGEHLTFVGHTHELGMVTVYGAEVCRLGLQPGRTFLRSEPCIINAGSVGQPRDGNNNAKYLLWDTDRGSVEVRFVGYDIAATVRKILDRGFPEYYASRLW